MKDLMIRMEQAERQHEKAVKLYDKMNDHSIVRDKVFGIPSQNEFDKIKYLIAVVRTNWQKLVVDVVLSSGFQQLRFAEKVEIFNKLSSDWAGKTRYTYDLPLRKLYEVGLELKKSFPPEPRFSSGEYDLGCLLTGLRELARQEEEIENRDKVRKELYALEKEIMGEDAT